MNHYLTGMKNYTTFSGRASRSEYWFFTLFYVIGYLVCFMADGLIGTLNAEAGSGLLSGIFAAGHIIPAFAVLFRRLHDTDRSGWWWVLLFVPLIGAIALIVFLCQKSTPGPNRFGHGEGIGKSEDAEPLAAKTSNGWTFRLGGGRDREWGAGRGGWGD